MKIIDQSYEILSKYAFEDQLGLIELAGRTAYKSEDKITETSSKEFAKMIRGKGHEAVLEHSFLSVKFITDRGVSHEIVRHRLAAFTQESTRYCNYSKAKFNNGVTFIRPVWFSAEDIARIIDPTGDLRAEDFNCLDWVNAMETAEEDYLKLLKNGQTPQQARAVLPNSLKTEIVVSTNFREWRHIFKLRAISKAAHPQMRDLMIPLYTYCRERLPEIFDMGEVE